MTSTAILVKSNTDIISSAKDVFDRSVPMYVDHCCVMFEYINEPPSLYSTGAIICGLAHFNIVWHPGICVVVSVTEGMR